MTKKLNVKSFLKGKAFYVILFVCLCVIGTTAVVTARKSITNNKQATNLKDNENTSIAQNEGSSVIEYDNAELVQKEDTQEVVIEDTIDEDNEDIQTSTSPSEVFISPITNGVVTRNYNISPRVNDEKTSATVYKGIDIESSIGSDVKSIAEGKVIDAGKGNSKEGYYVTIEHEDGFRSTYGNLEENLAVTIGDTVAQGTVLGQIGSTIQNNPSDRVSEEYLLFHMEKSQEPINPTEYINELKVK
ncbi:MAG: M23 family metallopeptidase [Clostridium perfringens]|nr:M23 family metallopeptidase [Clostridium perfringens]